MALCAGNSPVPGEFPALRPVTRSFDVYFDLRLNKRLSKQWWGWWFETPSRPLWRQCNDTPQVFQLGKSKSRKQTGLRVAHGHIFNYCWNHHFTIINAYRYNMAISFPYWSVLILHLETLNSKTESTSRFLCVKWDKYCDHRSFQGIHIKHFRFPSGNLNYLIFHTQLWFPAPDRDFRRFESEFRCFVKSSQEKTLWKK